MRRNLFWLERRPVGRIAPPLFPTDVRGKDRAGTIDE